MPPENIDDLFRQQLGGHATPPDDELWARLHQQPADEALDSLFRAGLRGHASQPRREVWERLEDEHLRPQPRRQRRVAAWWQVSAAAVLLLALLGGGAALWQRGRLGGRAGGLATADLIKSVNKNAAAATTNPATTNIKNTAAATEATAETAVAEAATAHKNPVTLASALAAATAAKKKQQIFSTQATASLATTSSLPKATSTRPGRPATVRRATGRFQQNGQLPDAATSQLAHAGGRKTPAGQPSLTGPTERVAPVASATKATDAVLAMASSTEAPAGIIEVEVRRGGSPAARPAPVAVAAAPAADAAPARRPRLRLGGLLRQADHLVHGEPVSLAEATGLPESVTVQARLGGRSLSRTIQL